MQIAPDQIDPDAAKVVQRLRRYDHAAYLVGGCVRDLLLGRKPKDFDVVTSATPQEIKRLFRNCRIIGRRFRLAHIFFGPKIIETSTFRANPRELEEEEGDSGPEAESGDLLIRRDNVFGTPEEDARRRDFTINGLFYDLETAQVIDHVNGMADLEARVVRTIGDPDIRFREDPIRILRAVKFAARCDLTIEAETYRRMMEHRHEISKCAQARVSEEFYRLLRGGAANRSMELLAETELLDFLSPEIAQGLKGEAEDEATVLKRARLWAYLAALDRSTNRRPVPPSNSLLLAVLMLPPLRDALDPDSNAVRDVGQMVALGIQPSLERLRASRRDGELARQILLAIRYILPSKQPRRRRPRLAGREFFDEALRLCEIISDAETENPALAGKPIVVEGGIPPDLAEGAEGEAQGDDDSPPELEPLESFERGRRRRRGRGQGRDEGRGEVRGQGRDDARGRPDAEPRRTPGVAAAPAYATGSYAPRPAEGLDTLLTATALLLAPSGRPAFLGTGSFGGPWSKATEG
ncbi:MAG TPA: polynucleotide adenylyltransferase PcnB [Polyangia bacterium]|jgi:poly(A) polymerase|nr:polynucleotide adenylyltransferase PcnB [Polyangia bacterium]